MLGCRLCFVEVSEVQFTSMVSDGFGLYSARIRVLAALVVCGVVAQDL